MCNGHERKKGCGRKMKDIKMEQQLIEWIKQEIKNGNGLKMN